jgi:hypothetical protein
MLGNVHKSTSLPWVWLETPRSFACRSNLFSAHHPELSVTLPILLGMCLVNSYWAWPPFTNHDCDYLFNQLGTFPSLIVHIRDADD